jgi:hypothetical protein
MGEALRGSRLGAVSYETDRGVVLAPRSATTYLCPTGHLTEVPFSVEADIPAQWECRTCRAIALRVDGEQPEAVAGRKLRTPWDMLVERRSVDDLEDLLAERLTLLRGAGGASRVVHADYRTATESKPRRRRAAEPPARKSA